MYNIETLQKMLTNKRLERSRQNITRKLEQEATGKRLFGSTWVWKNLYFEPITAWEDDGNYLCLIFDTEDEETLFYFKEMEIPKEAKNILWEDFRGQFEKHFDKWIAQIVRQSRSDFIETKDEYDKIEPIDIQELERNFQDITLEKMEEIVNRAIHANDLEERLEKFEKGRYQYGYNENGYWVIRHKRAVFIPKKLYKLTHTDKIQGECTITEQEDTDETLLFMDANQLEEEVRVLFYDFLIRHFYSMRCEIEQFLSEYFFQV